MFNLAFIFEDALSAMKSHGDRLRVIPLAATTYLMQVDVINHYRYAISHYFTVSLDSHFLQNSSLGTPYQKWAFFTNQDFDAFSLAVHNLLRYTSRLLRESECVALLDDRRFSECKSRDRIYLSVLGGLRRGKSIGIKIHEQQRLSIVAIRTEACQYNMTARAAAVGPTGYFRVVMDADGNVREEPSDKSSYMEWMGHIAVAEFDIADRSMLVTFAKNAGDELKRLTSLNAEFSAVCDEFYKSKPVAQPFDELIPSWLL